MIRRHPFQAGASVIAFTVVLIASTASAQTSLGPAVPDIEPGATLQLSLEDAVRRAVGNNPDLKIVELTTHVEAAKVGESRSAYAPVFSTTAGRSSSVTPPSNSLVGDRGVDVNDWFSSTGVRQRLPWGGGTWNISWDTSRTTTTSPLTSFDPSLQSGIQIAFSQPLLKDRAMDAARHQYLIAKRSQDKSELRFHEAVIQTIAAVKQAYWTLKASVANVTVQQRSLELADELVRQNKARVSVGQVPPLDLVQAEAEVAQRRESLIRATAAAEDAEDRLRRLIIDPADRSFWRVRLQPSDEPTTGAPLPDVDAAVARALEARYDVARARQDLATAATNVEFFANQKLPDVRFESSYRGSGLGGRQFLRTGTFPGQVTGTVNRSFGEALGQAFTNDYPAWSFGLTVSYPVGGGYEEASLARARIEREQAAHRIASLQLEAAESIRQSGRQVRSTAERVDAARAGATLAEQRFVAEQRRYEVGLSTSFLVTQAQRDLLQAEVNLLQATLDHQSSLINFEALQQVPPIASGETVGISGANVVVLPTPAPRGLFRQGAGTGLAQ